MPTSSTKKVILLSNVMGEVSNVVTTLYQTGTCFVASIDLSHHRVVANTQPAGKLMRAYQIGLFKARRALPKEVTAAMLFSDSFCHRTSMLTNSATATTWKGNHQVLPS